MKTTFLILHLGLVLCGLPVCAAGAADDVQSHLQRGLFEEEANQNLDAAIQAYQAVIQRADDQRRFAATAIFRLGKCYRKMGQTNAAATQYQRLLRDYSDQAALAQLSRQNLAGLGVASAGQGAIAATPQTNEEEAEIRRITALIKNSPDLINARSDKGQTPLTTAAMQGHLAVAQFLLRNRAQVDLPGPIGMTPLHYAAANGHQKLAELLLDSGANVNAATDRGQSPLHLALEKGFLGVAELLLARKADANAADNNGVTPLFEALYKPDSPRLIQLLLRHGARADVSNNRGSTPLSGAAASGNIESAKLLLAAGAKVNAQDAEGWSPLHSAARAVDLSMVNLLLTNGANPNLRHQDATPLMTALEADRGRIAPVVRALLKGGADPNLIQSAKANSQPPRPGGSQNVSRTPLQQAVVLGDPEVVAAMLEFKGNPNLAEESPNASWYPVHHAAVSGKVPIMSLLLKAGANPNAQVVNTFDQSVASLGPLHLAVRNKHIEIVALLLENKADVNLKDIHGQTPLMFAVSSAHAPILELLLKQGADPEIRPTDGSSPLMRAMSRNEPFLKGIDLLLAHGVNLNARDASGRTPLHLAVVLRNVSIVQKLLAAKADINAVDNEGRTPLDYVRSELSPGQKTSPQTPGALVTIPPPQGITFRTTPGGSGDGAEARKIAMLLVEAAGGEWMPRPGQITVIRRSANLVQPVFFQDPEGLNRFTVLEAVFEAYRNRNSPLTFPDFSAITIIRRDPQSGKVTEIPVDLGIDPNCASNVPLQWGDLVDLPERVHGFDQMWSGLENPPALDLAKCLEREVIVAVKDRSTNLTLQVKTIARSHKDGKPLSVAVQELPFTPREALVASGLLLNTSDLSRVRVHRKDPATGATNTIQLNLSRETAPPQPRSGKDATPTAFWLRDGDRIEVPQKQP